MKKLFIAILTAALIVLPLVACSPSQLGDGLTEYEIDATLDAENRLLNAKMKVDFVNETQSELDKICFHLYGNAYREGAAVSPISAGDISSAYPDGLSYGHMTVSKVTDGSGKELEFSTDENDILTVAVRKLMPTERTTVNIEFELGIAELRHRLGYYDGKFNLGNWYPVVCSFKNGEWVKHPYYSNGDPFDSAVANYHVTLRYPSTLVAASTGGEGKDGLLDVSARCVRDFAIAVGDFNTASAEVDGIKVTWYAESDDDYSSVAADALATFGKLFGKYPYPSLAVVKTAFLNGGMEYPGLVYISDALNDEMIKEVIVHETAHQWWYGVVGNDQVNEAWLDEGLAEYSTTVFYEKNPSYGVQKDARIADALTTYMLYSEIYKNDGKEITAMDKCVNDYATNLEYTYMTYVKGQLLFDNIRSLVGDDAFFGGLKDYFETNKFGVATKADLVGAFEKASKYRLDSFVDSWVDGSALLYTIK